MQYELRDPHTAARGAGKNNLGLLNKASGLSSRPDLPGYHPAGDLSGPITHTGRPFRGARGRRATRGRPAPKNRSQEQSDGGTFRPVPRPSHLSKVPGEDRNDPLYRDAVFSSPSEEFREMPDEYNLYSGSEGLRELTHEVYGELSANNAGIARRVPEEALHFYTATLTYARLLRVHRNNGYRTTNGERDFVDAIEAANFQPPEPIADYLSGLGNCTAPSGRELRFRLLDRTYIRSEDDETDGWFGKVNARTHFLYRVYPNPRVFWYSLEQLVGHSRRPHDVDEYWDLPDDMAPDYAEAEHPNENFLGYFPARRLPPPQLEWIMSAGVGDQITEHGETDDVLFVPNFMARVQYELDAASTFSARPAPQASAGSTAQLTFVEPDITRGLAISAPTVGYTAVQIPASVGFIGSAFRYRVQYDSEARDESHRGNWCVYTFQDDELPRIFLGRFDVLGRQKKVSFLVT